MRLQAAAKINWTLEVLGRRSDGYHELRTLMQTINLCDELEFASGGKEVRVQVEGYHLAEEDNLVLKAARLLADENQGAIIRLHKRIPPAAGLGGGSSDAAATLRGLSQIWGKQIPREELRAWASTLGSDVPFFLYGGTALASGRGEIIEPLRDIPQTWLVLLAPPTELQGKTARMYAELIASHHTDGTDTKELRHSIEQGNKPDPGLLFNIFEMVADRVFPQLREYRQRLLDAGARRTHLAGSGPALFALADSEEAGRAILSRLDPGLGQAFLARSLTRDESLASGA
ncbi:MAG TPA: 4-(cytidine 5'-diphospho)-2-C-methyl-D-erythritol kinase [Dehalococcoidia bacterium]|nr:4-(cytidine 5'-diphospho)-2-C-methyl-D-erythritol kinase [Dehalococcoidia bacterium]